MGKANSYSTTSLEPQETLPLYFSQLREKLWKEGKIRRGGYTYKEWKERNKNGNK